MMTEVLTALKPQPGGCYVDGTVGGGGHAFAILKASSPDGWLYGADRDRAAVEAAQRRLAEFAGRFEIRHGNFAELAGWIRPGSCDGALLDLGVSSAQLDQAERGFSFQQNGPLDMRMDRDQPVTAAQVVNEASADELARIFWELGGERESRRIARAIERNRKLRGFETTGQLAGLVERVIPRKGNRLHPATRVFQALRLRVNEELDVLPRGLAALWTILKPSGRLAVITFHSLEDRIVKDFGRKLARDYSVEGEVDVPELRRPKPAELQWVNRKAIQPSAGEISENPRARSAQLRVMEKI
jgi:16S rRNA (cytosine1402-N4)-methyltransferase